MKSSNRKKKEVVVEEPTDADEAGNGSAKFAPDHLFFDENFTPVVEKILGRKLVANEDGEKEELFFIKWRYLSYLHATWERRVDIERVDQQGKNKIKRFFQSPNPPAILGELTGDEVYPISEEAPAVADSFVRVDEYCEDEIEYFNPNFVEVDRIISCDRESVPHPFLRPKAASSRGKKKSASAADDSAEADLGSVQYLVKWQGQPYCQCSWERWTSLQNCEEEVTKFWNNQKAPPLERLQAAHPTLQQYAKLTESPVFGNPDEVSSTVGGLVLRDYQLEGVNWLLWNWWLHRPCILADEMGLGKTIQTIGFLHQLRSLDSTNIRGPFIVVAPLSLVEQWQTEVATWSPSLNCIVYHGSTEARELIQRHEFYFNEPFTPKASSQALKKANVCKFNILLTTYEIAIKDIRTLSRIQWEVLIVDEAHRLKNPTSKLFEQLSCLPHKHCVLLTGTPLQNKTEELWALLHFADKTRFADQRDFVTKFGDLKDSDHVAQLHALLKPYLLRRVKEDVEKSLPPKEETIIEVALTTAQKQFYRAIYERNTAFLFKGSKGKNCPSLMNIMMELRKCCNHPYLVRGVEERILSDVPVENRSVEMMHNKMVESSGKLVLLDKLLPRLHSQGHRVLIFSQMVKVLNILEDFLKFRGYSFERLDGNTRASSRSEAVGRFCKASSTSFVMLLSTRAGGLGLNLTAADTVIIYDSDWNPHNDIQAQARAHRIGQTKAVMVYRLLTRKTYEMHMFHQASLKLGMDRAVLAHARQEQEELGMTDNNANRLALSAKEIDELLKRGAYDVFREDDTEQTEFVEADIDAILDRRSHKINYDGAGSMAASSLGSFSKASFVSADETEDVDINDPDFWKKAVGLSNDNPVDDEPTGSFDDKVSALPQQRKRKATQVYGDGDSVDPSQLNKMLLAQQREWERKEKEKEKKEKEKEKKEKERERKEIERQKKAEALAIAKAAKAAKDLAKQQFEASKAATSHRIPPAQWGPHARDRVLRALNLFGFGRWNRIRKESGGGLRELKDVEEFSRFYLLLCGLLISHEDRVKGDMDFIGDSIICARLVDTLTRVGEISITIPRSLYEDKFIGKLKAGLARKTLNKLDMCTCLNHLIGCAAENACRAKERPYDDVPLDIDALVAMISDEELAEHLPIGDARPQWAQLTPWWDRDCDRHLLIGVFKHGYGKFDLIRDDPSLVFARKFTEATRALASLHPGACAIMDYSMPTRGDSDSSPRTLVDVSSEASAVATAGDTSPDIADQANAMDISQGECSMTEDLAEGEFEGQQLQDDAQEQGQEQEQEQALMTVESSANDEFSTSNVSSEVMATEDSVTQADVSPVPVSSKSIFEALVSSMTEEQRMAALEGDVPTTAGGAEGEQSAPATPTPAPTTGHTRTRTEIPQKPKKPLPETRPFRHLEEECMPIQVTLAGNRECSILIPIQRKSRYRGVFSQPGSCRWVTLHGDTNPTMVGCFDTEIEAAKAYDHEARKRDGSNAVCNFDRLGVRNANVCPPAVLPPMPSHRSSKFRGVRASGSKWTCQISYEGGTHHLGTFSSEIEAAVAYDVSAIVNHGSDAALNFPFGVEQEILRFLREEGIYVTVFSPEGEVERAVSGSAETYAQLLKEGAILEGQRLPPMPKKTDGPKRKRGVKRGIIEVAISLNSSQAGMAKAKKLREDGEVDGCDDGGDDDTMAREYREGGLFMPDARTLNRLITWLLTSDTARIWGRDSKERLRMSMGSSFMKRGSSDGLLSSSEMAVDGSDVKGERRLVEIPRLVGNKLWQLEEQILGRIIDVMDPEAVHASLTDPADLIGRCRAVVSGGQDSTYGQQFFLLSGLDGTPSTESYPNSGDFVPAGCDPLVSPVGRVCIENFLRGVPVLSFADAELVSCALILHGAPVQAACSVAPSRFEFLRNVTCSPFISHSPPSAELSQDESTVDLAPTFEPASFSTYSWVDFQKRFCPWIDANLLCFFYVEIWLPCCAQLTRKGLKHRESAFARLVPHPYFNQTEHHPLVRGLCIQFLQRQQLLRSCNFVLSNYFSELWDYLRIPDRLTVFEGLPVWWTPYVHDLGLVMACARHGFLDIEAMQRDSCLPFKPKDIERHIRYFMQYGSLSVVPMALGAVGTDAANVEAWIEEMGAQFPSVALLEARLEHILEDLTKDLGASHPCKVIIIGGKFSSHGSILSMGRQTITKLEDALNILIAERMLSGEAMPAHAPRTAAPVHVPPPVAPVPTPPPVTVAPSPVEAPVEAPVAVSTPTTANVAESVAQPTTVAAGDAEALPTGASESSATAVEEQAVAIVPPAPEVPQPVYYVKNYLSHILRNRRVHVSEFKPARPMSFEICEYSEKLMQMAESHFRDDDDVDDDDDDDDRPISAPVRKPVKSVYSNFKKGV